MFSELLTMCPLFCLQAASAPYTNILEYITGQPDIASASVWYLFHLLAVHVVSVDGC